MGYTAKERFADFRRLFTSTPEGKRVFAEILSWGHMLKPSLITAPIDPYYTHIKEGERNMSLRLLATINNEPREKPSTAIRRKVIK